MACLDNVIGVRSECSNTTPTTSLYIDSLVSTKEMEKFVDAPHDTVSDLFTERLAMAIEEVRTDVYTHFSGNYITRSIIDSKRIGIFDEHRNASAAITNTYKGIEVRMNQTASSMKFVLSGLKFYSDHTGNVDVKVYNTISGELLDTITVAAVADEMVEVVVNKEYSSNLEPLYLGFVYDSTGVAAFKSTVGLTGCSSCSNTAYHSVNSWLQTRAINNSTASDVIQDNITGTSDTGGLSIVYSVECDHKSWMCNQKSILARPILYKTAEVIMEYALYGTDRFNDHNTKKEDYTARQLMYKEKYDELMKSVLNNMRMPNNDPCLKCERTNRMVTSLP